MRPRKIALSERGYYEPVPTEEGVIGAMRTLLELNGARIFRIKERIPRRDKFNRVVSSTSERGIPDLCGWFPIETPFMDESLNRTYPLHFWIEGKRPGGVCRPAQITWIEKAREDGVIAFFADSVERMIYEFRSYGIKIKGQPT